MNWRKSMADSNLEEKKSLEERGVVAIESIAKSFETLEDVILDLDMESWTERLEWYLNEFYLLAKSKIIDSSSDRPEVQVKIKSDK